MKSHPGREVLPWKPGRGQQTLLAQWPSGSQATKASSPEEAHRNAMGFLTSNAWSSSKSGRNGQLIGKNFYFLPEGLERKALRAV